MKDDAALLRSYVDEGSQEAFTELVRRHVDLVYGAAMRRTGGDPHKSADIAQQVFTTLARQARKLVHHPVLSGWLHTATRNAALNLMISEQRRKARETESVELAAIVASGNPSWERIRPVLDAAVDELGDVDRAAIVLRFLERKPFAEIGAVLQTSEDAARMRTERALDKLRVALGRHGITSTAAALSTVVAAQPLVSAPTGLAAALAAQSLAALGGTAGGLIAATFIMNTKTIAVVAVVVGLFFGAGTYVGRKYAAASTPPASPVPVRPESASTTLRDENAKLVGEISRLNAMNATLRGERDTLQANLAAVKKAMPPPPNPTEQKQKAMMNNLRQIAAARDQFRLENKRSPASILELVGADKYIRQMNPVAGEDYSNLSLSGDGPLAVTSADGITMSFDPKPANPPAAATPEQQQARERMQRARELGKKVTPTLLPAIEAFKAANDGRLPPNNEALIPYFPDPQQGADFVEYIEAEKAARGR